jgi:histidyl-tRNA synthetase
MPKKKSQAKKEPYKGVRDFYPEDQFVQDFIFDRARDVVEHYGYEEYNASILEPSELYAAKTSDEIVNEQTYNFVDRGNRKVTIRPEMTPTATRMISARRRELALPLRWYSIPNVFRYERPQHGRLREHWQLNCDLFGVPGVEADVEIILLAYELMRAFGASDNDFVIKLNNRQVIPETLALLAKQNGMKVTKDQQVKLVRLMDKRDKMKAAEYADLLRELLGDKLSDVVLKQYTPETIRRLIQETESGAGFLNLLDTLESRGIPNIMHDPNLVRGFDYYTGMIFEVVDTSPENPRALFGGGRYDELFELFGDDPMPAVGFGMGDVRIRDFLNSRKLVPAYISSTDVYLVVAEPESLLVAQGLAQRLRRRGVTVAVDITGRKLGDQLKTAAKKSIPFALIVGENERKTGKYQLKNLATKAQQELDEKHIADAVFETLE